MAYSYLKEASKVNWCVKVQNAGDYPGDNNLQLGCLMRIADATEMMAKRYTEMQDNLDWYKKKYAEHREEIKRMERQIAAYKGHIRRLKNSE
jgi:septal ring factor EnvC (AmiA/AmiB activator)